jgi:hypothetical protein
MRPYFLTCVATMIGTAAVISAAPAISGEIKGPPPTSNYTAEEVDIHSRSICAFSGLNDSPLGDAEQGDPGGITQSFGSFFGSSGNPVNELDPTTDSLSPGWSCNPNRGADLHGG